MDFLDGGWVKSMIKMILRTLKGFDRLMGDSGCEEKII